jgi:hypothetical protein
MKGVELIGRMNLMICLDRNNEYDNKEINNGYDRIRIENNLSYKL